MSLNSYNYENIDPNKFYIITYKSNNLTNLDRHLSHILTGKGLKSKIGHGIRNRDLYKIVELDIDIKVGKIIDCQTLEVIYDNNIITKDQISNLSEFTMHEEN